MPQDDRTDFEEANGYEDEKTVAIDPDGLIESNYDKVTDNFDDMQLKETCYEAFTHTVLRSLLLSSSAPSSRASKRAMLLPKHSLERAKPPLSLSQHSNSLTLAVRNVKLSSWLQQES